MEKLKVNPVALLPYKQVFNKKIWKYNLCRKE